MAYSESIVDKLSNALAPVIRDLEDLNNDLLGTKVSLLRITKTKVNNYGDMTYSVESNFVNNVILKYPLSEVELFDVIRGQAIDTEAINLWEVLPIEMTVKFEGVYNVDPIVMNNGDILVNILKDENGEMIPIIMQVIRKMGQFFGKSLVRRKYELSLVTGTLDDEVQKKIDEYIGEPKIKSTDPEDEKIDVAINIDIKITFNIPMDESSVESALQVNPTFTYAITWNGDKSEITLNPDVDLIGSTEHTITIGTGATSQAGHELEESFLFKFTTI